MIAKVTSTVCYLYLICIPLLFSQGKVVHLRERSFTQQVFAIEYLRREDSIYYDQHKSYKPFTSREDIDRYFAEFIAAWEKKYPQAGKAVKRLDSYVYGLIERAKSGGNWSVGYVWRKYMVPAFLEDFEYCRSEPEIEKASLLWPGNAGNIFGYALHYDLPLEEWAKMYFVHTQMPVVVDSYLKLVPRSDSVLSVFLENTRRYVAEFNEFYSVSNAVYHQQHDSAFGLLSVALLKGGSAHKYLQRPIKKMVSHYLSIGDKEKALQVLDLVARFTTDADIPKDSVKIWYQQTDSERGLARFLRVYKEKGREMFVLSKKVIVLEGQYTNLHTGESFELSTLQGKTVLLDFWATWCQPCIAEIPKLNEFSRRYSKRSDFVFLAISGDAVKGGAGIAEVQAFVKKYNMQYRVVYDRPDASLTELLAVNGWPSKYLIDPQGRILLGLNNVSTVTLEEVEVYLNQKHR